MSFMFSLNPKTVYSRICGEIFEMKQRECIHHSSRVPKRKKNTSVTCNALYVRNDHTDVHDVL